VTVLVVTHDAAVSAHVQRTIAIQDGRTSTEVLRQHRAAGDGEAGDSGGSAGADGGEEFAVLDRAGRLQLPRDFTDVLGMRDRVRLALEADHIAVWPGARIEGADGGDGGDNDGGDNDGGAHRRGTHGAPARRQEET
jgi:hypothetical protein